MSQDVKLNQRWTSVQFEVTPDQEDLACWVMMDSGAKGCTVDSPKDGKVLIKASFETSEMEKDAVGSLMVRLEEYGLAHCLKSLKVEQFADEDWFSEWKKHFAAFKVGDNLTICPPWQQHEQDRHHKIVIIDPGAAFGTGLHATTRYCLNALQKLSLGKAVVDVGTGSGILAIATALFHPDASITALDISANAIENARHNIELNKVDNRIKLIEGEPENVLTGKYDTILSNLTCEDIVALLPLYKKHLAAKGLIICAGIIQEKFALLTREIADSPLKIIDQEIEGEWVGVTLQNQLQS